MRKKGTKFPSFSFTGILPVFNSQNTLQELSKTAKQHDLLSHYFNYAKRPPELWLSQIFPASYSRTSMQIFENSVSPPTKHTAFSLQDHSTAVYSKNKSRP
jgi:hypothetical protein